MNCVIAEILQANIERIQDILLEEKINVIGIANNKTELYIILKNAEVDFVIMGNVFVEQTVNLRVIEEIQFYFPSVRVVRYNANDDKTAIINQMKIRSSTNTPPIPFN